MQRPVVANPHIHKSAEGDDAPAVHHLHCVYDIYIYMYVHIYSFIYSFIFLFMYTKYMHVIIFFIIIARSLQGILSLYIYIYTQKKCTCIVYVGLGALSMATLRG